jgi:hypothetical protein
MQMRSLLQGLQVKVPISLVELSLISNLLDLLRVGQLAPSALDQRLRLSLFTGGRLHWKAGGLELPPYGRSTTRPRLSTPTPPRTFSSVFHPMSWSLLTQLSPRRTLSPLLPSSQLAPRRSISKFLETPQFLVFARSKSLW